MTIQLDIMALIALMGIPSAITGLCFWQVQRKITRRDAAREKQDAARKKNEFLVIKGVAAAIALGEATAKSVQRLDPKCIAHCLLAPQKLFSIVFVNRQKNTRLSLVLPSIPC